MHAADGGGGSLERVRAHHLLHQPLHLLEGVGAVHVEEEQRLRRLAAARARLAAARGGGGERPGAPVVGGRRALRPRDERQLDVAQLGERRVSKMLDALGEKTVDDLWALTQRRTDLRLAELDAWRARELDAVICPPHVVPALGHRESGDFALSLGAEFRWTLLDFPAGIAPVTTVAQDDIGRCPRPTDRVEKKLSRIDGASLGLPVGVQIVARPYREEVLLSVMRTLDVGLRGREGYPTTPVNP